MTTTTRPHLRTGPTERPALALPMRMTAALAELHSERATVAVPAAGDPHGWVEACTRRMLLAARLSAWWGLLARWIATDSELPVLLARAATIAGRWELEEAERCRDDLAHWQARAHVAGGA